MFGLIDLPGLCPPMQECRTVYDTAALVGSILLAVWKNDLKNLRMELITYKIEWFLWVSIIFYIKKFILEFRSAVYIIDGMWLSSIHILLQVVTLCLKLRHLNYKSVKIHHFNGGRGNNGVWQMKWFTLNFIWLFHKYWRTAWNLHPVFNFSNHFIGGCHCWEIVCRNCHSLIIGLIWVKMCFN